MRKARKLKPLTDFLLPSMTPYRRCMIPKVAPFRLARWQNPLEIAENALWYVRGVAPDYVDAALCKWIQEEGGPTL